MNVILVDDEPTMHLILRKMLAKLPGIHVTGAFTDTQSAAVCIQERTDIELAFVDISMPGESGLSFAARLEQATPPIQVIFVTSHKDFALEAYELSVIDYLVKPVSQERLERAVHRAMANRRPALSPSMVVQTGVAPGRTVITMLGDVGVATEAGRVKWISRKCAELFAYLLLYRGKRIPRSRLLADIFGGMSQVNAENYLNTTVYQLRKSLEPLGLRETIRSENDGYALEVADPHVDYEEFETQAGQLLSIDAGNMEEARRIERLYTGDLFGDKAYLWAIYETERFAGMYASFALRLAEACISARELDSAAKLLQKLNDRNPLDETVIKHLMMIRKQAGDKKGLTALYTSYVRLLSRELGIRPSKELLRHYDLLVSREAD